MGGSHYYPSVVYGAKLKSHEAVALVKAQQSALTFQQRLELHNAYDMPQTGSLNGNECFEDSFIVEELLGMTMDNLTGLKTFSNRTLAVYKMAKAASSRWPEDDGIPIDECNYYLGVHVDVKALACPNYVKQTMEEAEDLLNIVLTNTAVRSALGEEVAARCLYNYAFHQGVY